LEASKLAIRWSGGLPGTGLKSLSILKPEISNWVVISFAAAANLAAGTFGTLSSTITFFLTIYFPLPRSKKNFNMIMINLIILKFILKPNCLSSGGY
jgi:hypothetical protein